MPLDPSITATRAIKYETSERIFDGLVFEGTSQQLILVLPDWRGCLTDNAMRRGHDIHRCTGATVCVTDPYGAGKKPNSYAGDAEVWISQELTNPDRLRHQLKAQFSALCDMFDCTASEASVVGYCLGGALALEAGRAGMGLRSVVSVHGIPSTKQPLASHPGRTSFLSIHGADDPIIGLDHLRHFEAEMSAVGADWSTFTIGGARHGFTDEDADPRGSHQRYDARGAKRALAVIEGFLKVTRFDDD